jgi:hypothetical protein
LTPIRCIVNVNSRTPEVDQKLKKEETELIKAMAKKKS